MLTDLLAYELGELSKEESIAMFQDLIDTGMAWQLQGSYGRTAADLIEDGSCMLGTKGHRDYYGNYIPSRFEVAPGAPGSEEFWAKGGVRCE